MKLIEDKEITLELWSSVGVYCLLILEVDVNFY